MLPVVLYAVWCTQRRLCYNLQAGGDIAGHERSEAELQAAWAAADGWYKKAVAYWDKQVHHSIASEFDSE